jgi:hypothetical protein
MPSPPSLSQDGVDVGIDEPKHLTSSRSSRVGLNPSKGILQAGSVASTRANPNTIHGTQEPYFAPIGLRWASLTMTSSLTCPTSEAAIL